MADENYESLQRLSKESGIPYLVVLVTGVFSVGFLLLLPLDYLINGPIGPEPAVVEIRRDLSNQAEYLVQKAVRDAWASRKMFREVVWIAGPISLVGLILI